MTKLASLANCQGWLSIDRENYDAGLLAYAQEPGVWKLALLQEEETCMSEVVDELAAKVATKEIVSFPCHRGGHHVKPIVDAGFFTCPAVLGVHKLEPNAGKLRPCQSCSFCLP